MAVFCVPVLHEDKIPHRAVQAMSKSRNNVRESLNEASDGMPFPRGVVA